MKSLLDALEAMPDIRPEKGASDEIIAGVERALGFRFPEDYKTLLRRHDGGVFAGARLFNLAQDGNFRVLSSEVQKIETYLGEELPKVATREMIPVGDDGGGHLFLLDLRGADAKSCPVLEWGHGASNGKEPAVAAHSIQAFVEDKLVCAQA